MIELYRDAIPTAPEALRDGSLVEQFDPGPLRAFRNGEELSVEEVELLAKADPEMESVAKIMRKEAAA